MTKKNIEIRARLDSFMPDEDLNIYKLDNVENISKSSNIKKNDTEKINLEDYTFELKEYNNNVNSFSSQILSI